MVDNYTNDSRDSIVNIFRCDSGHDDPYYQKSARLVVDPVFNKEIFGTKDAFRSAKIWRYDSPEHVIDILAHRSLYIPRADKFDDRYEGLLFLRDEENHSHKRFLKPSNADHYYVSCWHFNDRENISWWERYRSDKLLAVQTTVGGLTDSLSEMSAQSVVMVPAQVFYESSIATERHLAEVIDLNSYENYLVKDSDFSHEKEFRLICRIPEKPGACDTPSCLRPPINLEGLQGKIVVSPFCSSEERESLLSCLNQYDSGLTIEESSLTTPESADNTTSFRVYSDRLMNRLIP